MEMEGENGNDQWKMPDKGHHVNIQVRFYSTVLPFSIVGSFH